MIRVYIFHFSKHCVNIHVRYGRVIIVSSHEFSVHSIMDTKPHGGQACFTINFHVNHIYGYSEINVITGLAHVQYQGIETMECYKMGLMSELLWN